MLNRLREIACIAWLLILSSWGCCEEFPLGVGPSDPIRAGFTVRVLGSRLGNEGFQPLTLRFRATGQSFNRQRRLRLLLRPRNQYATNIDFQFSRSVTLPEGVRTHDVEILVPHFYRWESCSLHVLEDGKLLDRQPLRLGIQSACKDWGQHVSVGIIVPRDAEDSTANANPANSASAAWKRFPDVRSIVTVLGDGPIPEDSTVTRQSNDEARDYLSKLQSGWVRFRILDEDKLPTSWLAYSQLDLILVPYPVLARIESERPDAAQALQSWLSTGTQIWSYGSAGANLPWLSGDSRGNAGTEVFSSDPVASLRLSEINDQAPIQYQAWNLGSYYAGGHNPKGTSRRTAYRALEAAKHPIVQKVSKQELMARFRSVPYGLGKVVLIENEDPFPGSFQLWKTLNENLTWTQRQGVSYSGGNDSYWSWLMMTVGMPPVTMFLVLNGLFVLIMGPLLYFGLRRRGRLYLLYFTAPALALLATLGLFLYAFVSDGFSNLGRVRQLTLYDGRYTSGESIGNTRSCPVVDQSRQTFYTVTDSGHGLRYDADALVLPVFHREMLTNYRYRMADHEWPGDYRIEKTDTQRIYSGGFLPIRSQVHSLVTRPGESAFPITVSFGNDPVTLTNHLDTALDAVAVCDADGGYWTGNAVASGETVALKAVKVNVFAGVTAGMIEPATHSLPQVIQARVSAKDQSAMERRFEEFVRVPERRTFVARTAIQPERLPLRNCRLEDSGRLIGGYLP